MVPYTLGKLHQFLNFQIIVAIVFHWGQVIKSLYVKLIA
jgi:hypothetical protein